MSTTEAFGMLSRVPDLELIVPAFNEQERIYETLVALVGQLQQLPLAACVRVIDNGSYDRTPDLVDRLSHSEHRVVVTVEGCSGRGKGAAVARGMVTSTARYVGFCDADLATPAEAIIEALELLDQGWPVVIGSRRCEGAAYLAQQSLVRRIGGYGFRTLTRQLAGDIADTQCGFKFFHGDVARELFANMHLGGFAFDVEILARAKARGMAVYELPVNWTDKAGSTFRPVADGIGITKELWRLKQTHRRLAESAAVGR